MREREAGALEVLCADDVGPKFTQLSREDSPSESNRAYFDSLKYN